MQKGKINSWFTISPSTSNIICLAKICKRMERWQVVELMTGSGRFESGLHYVLRTIAIEAMVLLDFEITG
jgi:hypothetical protein